MWIYASGAFLITIFNCVLWFLTFFGRKLGALARAYFWWSFFVAIWAFGYGITLSGFFDYDTTLTWNKFCQSMAMMIGPFFYKYCVALVDEYPKQRKIFIFYLIFAAINSIGIFFTPYYVSGLWSFGIYRYQPLGGPLYLIYVALFVICTFHGFLLVLLHFRSFSEIKRKQLQLFLIATGISYFGGLTLFLQPFRIQIDSFGVFLCLTYVLATGSAIHRYQFLDFTSLLRTKEIVAIHNEKLMLLGLFSSSVNHEIKNPLFLLQEFSKKLLSIEVVSQSSEAVGTLQKMSDQISRISRLVERFGEFIRPSPAGDGALEDIQLKQVIDNALFFASVEMKYQNIETKVNVSDDFPVLKGDKSQFEVIFLNLIVNAYHAMAGGGTLTIEAKATTSMGHLDFARGDDAFHKSVMVSVIDTGHGIPKDQLKNIFKPFYTTKGKSGTGLGLHIVKTLVEQNGGKISVESKVGEGTNFKLIFETPLCLFSGNQLSQFSR